MSDFSRDPIINVIHNGIKKSIRVLLEHECCGGAVVLIYSGMDTMAFLGMPAGQVEVKPTDFIHWAEKYIRFPCKEQLTGADLYGARCGMLHNYSPVSRSSRKGHCRHILYMDKIVPAVIYNPKDSTEHVMVSVIALAEAFFQGVDSFMVHLFADKARANIAEERFRWVVHSLPLPRRESEEI